jgi:hypothetical protein
MHTVRSLAGVAVLAFGACLASVSQQLVQDTSGQPTVPTAAPMPGNEANLQSPQQKQLADDTAKLLALANELKTELDKSNKDMLSLSVIKKAEQVEKLAHKVRDEMKANLVN